MTRQFNPNVRIVDEQGRLTREGAQLLGVTQEQTGFQPADDTLTALAGLSATPGLMAQTGTDSFAKRTLRAPLAGLTIANPAGTGGDPTFALANDIAAIEALSGTGFPVRTALDAWAQRSIAGTSPVQVANADGASANPTISVNAGTDTAAGILELATNAETITGTDTARACHPAGVAAAIAAAGGGVVDSWVEFSGSAVFQGFGTVTGVSLWSRRVGDTLFIRGKWTNGTVAASEGRLTFFYNGSTAVTSHATKVASIQLAGSAGRSSVGGAAVYTLIESGVAYLTFGVQNAGRAALTKVNGDTVGGTGDTISILAEVPISGW